jgi:tripartite-type tricarboxylate transporter receptor subunit TctC
LPGFSSVTWFGLYGPKGLSADLVARIHGEFTKALQSPDVIDRLARLGTEPARVASTVDFVSMVARDSERWGRIIRDRKITIE